MLETKKFKVNLGTFDLVKGIAMMLVVIGHVRYYFDTSKMTIAAPLFFLVNFVVSGLMPMFFMISGYSFKKKTVGVMVKETARDLLKPYALVAVSVMIFFPIIHYLAFRWWPGAIQETVRYFLAFLLGVAKPGKIVLGYALYDCAVVWFLLALFVGENLLNLILKIQHEYLQVVLVTVCVFAGWVLYTIDFTYFCLPQGLSAVGFCYIGCLIKKYKLLERLKSTKALYGIYLVLFLITFWHSRNSVLGLAYGVYNYFGLDYFCAACAGLLFLLWGAYGGQVEWNGLNLIRKVGLYTYWIMCAHSVEEICIPWYKWSEIMANHQLLGFVIELGIKAVIYTGVCLVLKKISRYRYLKKRAQLRKT